MGSRGLGSACQNVKLRPAFRGLPVPEGGLGGKKKNKILTGLDVVGGLPQTTEVLYFDSAGGVVDVSYIAFYKVGVVSNPLHRHIRPAVERQFFSFVSSGDWS